MEDRRKTNMMLRAEARLHAPLEKIIPETFNRTGSMLNTAEALGIPLHTLYRWIDKLHLEKQTTHKMVRERR